jgi:GT2 family glycosyltransferase
MKLFVVVVIYKMRPSESPTLQTLMKSIDRLLWLGERVSVLIWDNTPNGQDPGRLDPGVRYVSAPENPGLAKAYNHASEIAEAEGFEWLLTLDQDTRLPDDFVEKILEAVRGVQSEGKVAAIVPQVIGDNRPLSPFRFAGGALPRLLPPGYAGMTESATYAVNSAATIRIASLRQVGGYNPLFPLDISDIDLFHRIHRAGMWVLVAGDVVVSHEFSLFKKQGRMSVARYRSQLRDECAFWDMHMTWLARVERMCRLAGRVCKDSLRPGNAAFQRITIGEIVRRLVTRRSKRIVEWNEWAFARQSFADHGIARTVSFAASIRTESISD